MVGRMRFVKRAVLFAVAFLLAVPAVRAQADGRGSRSPDKMLGFGQYPWGRPGYRGYNEPSRTPPPSATAATPQRYTLRVTVLHVQNEDDSNAALIMAHLPEDASIWFEDTATQQTGTLRHFRTPPLTPGKEYAYTVRVQWYEGGKWVSQVHNFSVRAGDVHCIDVVPTESPTVQQDVTANLAKLEPDDRKAAEAQRFCAVQEGIRLGSMGVPFKVTVKGEPVFLCCEGCSDKARNKPEKTLEQVKRLKAKNATASSPHAAHDDSGQPVPSMVIRCVPNGTKLSDFPLAQQAFP
jgi:uncharacterized protein (TIGR03000 family)